MKKFISVVTASLILTTTNSSGFTEIVTALGGKATEATQILNNLELITQVKHQLNTLLSQTEVRDTVEFIKDIQQLQSVMDEWKIDLMDLDLDNPKSQIGAIAKQLFDKYNLFDDCSYEYLDEDRKRICKNEMVRNVQEISAYQNYSTQLQTYSNKLKDLSQKLAESKDIKESQDISNAINMQLAQIQTTKAQIDLMRSNNQAIRDAEKRQKEQLYKKNRGMFIDHSNTPI